jgi:hypothetical protein
MSVAVEQLSATPEGVAISTVAQLAGTPAVARANRDAGAVSRRQHAVDRPRIDRRLVAQRDHDRLDEIGERGHAAAQRCRLTLLPSGTDDRHRAVTFDICEDLVGVCAKHDDRPVDALGAGHREQCVLQQRPAVEQRQLLGRAET